MVHGKTCHWDKLPCKQIVKRQWFMVKHDVSGTNFPVNRQQSKDSGSWSSMCDKLLGKQTTVKKKWFPIKHVIWQIPVWADNSESRTGLSYTSQLPKWDRPTNQRECFAVLCLCQEAWTQHQPKEAILAERLKGSKDYLRTTMECWTRKKQCTVKQVCVTNTL